MAEQQRVACVEVIVGDAILPSTLQSDRELDQLANVTGVTLLGVNVKIDTDLGISVLLPINRSIIVWRNSAWQKRGMCPNH